MDSTIPFNRIRSFFKDKTAAQTEKSRGKTKVAKETKATKENRPWQPLPPGSAAS